MAAQQCPSTLSNMVKAEAHALGFDGCGIASAQKLHDLEPILQKWIQAGNHGEMRYMENHFDKRLDPTILVEGAKSVIVVALGYFPETRQQEHNNYIVSKYAYGADYHVVMKEKLRMLEKALLQLAPGHKGRVFADSAPVMEKAWAHRAGLGWIGKNTCLIIPRKGSFFFLGELITNIELTADQFFDNNYCGNCNRCIDACPTGALEAPGTLIAHRCISYLTIELKGAIPQEYRNGKLKGRIFGCDICQDVCPHNRFSKPTGQHQFHPLEDVISLSASEWEQLDASSFSELFKTRKSPIARVSFEKLHDNIASARIAPGL